MKKNNKHRIFAVESLNAIRKFDDDRYDKDDCNQASKMIFFFILAAHNLLLAVFYILHFFCCSRIEFFICENKPIWAHDTSRHIIYCCYHLMYLMKRSTISWKYTENRWQFFVYWARCCVPIRLYLAQRKSSVCLRCLVRHTLLFWFVCRLCTAVFIHTAFVRYRRFHQHLNFSTRLWMTFKHISYAYFVRSCKLSSYSLVCVCVCLWCGCSGFTSSRFISSTFVLRLTYMLHSLYWALADNVN